MKKLLIVLLAVAMLFAFAACAQEPAEPDTSATDVEEEEVLTMGQLICSNVSAEEIVAYLASLGLERKVIFYNDLNTMLLALQAGDIDMISGLPEAVAD